MFTKSKDPPVQHLMSRYQEVAYLMGDLSGNGFGSLLWREDVVECDSGEFTLIYQGRYSKFRESNNMVNMIKNGVDKGYFRSLSCSSSQTTGCLKAFFTR